MKNHFLIIFLLLTLLGVSQSSQIIDKQKIFFDLSQVGDGDGLRNFNADFYRSIVFENDSVLFYNPEGTLHLYKISLSRNPTVLKLSNGDFHGHNFHRLLFMYNNTIYCYGGDGLFNVNPHLIYFDGNNKEWLKQQIKNYPFDSRNVINSWVIGDTLKVLLNHWCDFDQTSPYGYTKYSFGFIDLKNFEYRSEIIFNDDSHSDFIIPSSNYLFDFKEITLFGYKEENGLCSFSCLDKRNGDLFPIPLLNQISYVDGESSIYVDNRTLFFQSSESELDTIKLDQIPTIPKKNFIKLYYLQSSTNSTMLIAIMLGFLFVGLGITGVFLKKKTNPKMETEHEFFLKNIENELVSHRGMTLPKSKIEQIFQIYNLDHDGKKRIRSRLIREINEREKVKIERVRQQEDKRFFNYRIS